MISYILITLYYMLIIFFIIYIYSTNVFLVSHNWSSAQLSSSCIQKSTHILGCLRSKPYETVL